MLLRTAAVLVLLAGMASASEIYNVENYPPVINNPVFDSDNVAEGALFVPSSDDLSFRTGGYFNDGNSESGTYGWINDGLWVTFVGQTGSYPGGFGSPVEWEPTSAMFYFPYTDGQEDGVFCSWSATEPCVPERLTVYDPPSPGARTTLGPGYSRSERSCSLSFARCGQRRTASPKIQGASFICSGRNHFGDFQSRRRKSRYRITG